MGNSILSNLIVNKIFTASTMYNKENVENRRNNRERWAIILKYEGETVYFSRGKQYLSNANNIVILPKGVSYKWRCTRSGHYSVIEFDSESESEEILSFSLKSSEKILKLFKNLELKRMQNKENAELESMKDVYTVLSMLAAAEPKKYQPAEKHVQIDEWDNEVVQNYNIKIRNDELAALTGVSTVYFRKLFTEVMGQSPIDYIQSLRIQKAKEMLQSDYGSITDVASALGYQSIYDFSRAFKKRVGMSPIQYKKRK